MAHCLATGGTTRPHLPSTVEVEALAFLQRPDVSLRLLYILFFAVSLMLPTHLYLGLSLALKHVFKIILFYARVGSALIHIRCPKVCMYCCLIYSMHDIRHIIF